MAKQPKTPSGKKKTRSKEAVEVVEAEIVGDDAPDPSDSVEDVADAAEAENLFVETVPEDSDFDADEELEIEEIVPDDSADVSHDTVTQDEGPEGSSEPASDDGPVEEAASEAPEAEPEPAPAVVAPPPPKPGLFGSVLGGAIAAAIGFIAAMFIFPQGWQERDDSALKAVEAGLADQKSALEEQKGAVENVSSDVASLTETVTNDIAAVQEEATAGTTGVAELDARLSALTKSDGTTKLPDDVQILLNTQKAELDALRDEVAGLTAAAKEQMEAASAQQEDADKAEARVKARSALQKVRLGLESGDPFADVLADIEGAVDLPDGLVAVADAGVPTQQALQAGFPDAARAALAVSLRETSGSDTRSRLQLFFKDQLGARSLAPREGDDADAVLSRAEAAVKAEDYVAALSEVDALPEAAQEAFANWRALAQARVGAVAGYEAVSDALNEN